MAAVLAQQLAGAPRRPTPLDALKLARRTFIACERIEMKTLAAHLSVSRVTLNRWVGDRDELLGEVCWSLAEPTLRNARSASRAVGGAGIAETIERFIDAVVNAPFMRTFLEREPEIALRVLTTKRSPVQSRLVDAFAAMLAEEVDADHLQPLMDLHDLAYVLVRLGESFCYADIIAGGEPDPAKAGLAIRALLR